MSKSITLDARKVIKYINESAQSQVATIDETLRNLGDKTGQKYSLVALHPKSLMFEDADGQYYIANYDRSRGNRINLSKITKIQIQESKKSHVFNNACVELVESVSKADDKGSEIAFRKLESCRFRSTVATNDGFVTTRDGQRRRFNTEQPMMEDTMKLVVEAVVRAMQENVIVEDNQVVGAKIGDVDIKIPITETMRRLNIAKKMKHIAEGAWESPRFQKFTKHIAGLVSKNLIKEAVAESAKFFKEYQEFSLLNLSETEAIVENALAIHNQYNPILAENTAMLMYKTNLTANKDDIISAWEKTARVAADPVVLEEVLKLSKSSDFHNDYQKFLYSTIVEGTKVPEDFLLKFLLVIKKLIKGEIDSMESSETGKETGDEVSGTLNDVLSGGESEVENAGAEDLAFEGHNKNGKVIAEEDSTVAKYKKALGEIEDMITGVEGGDPEKIESATNMVQGIDVERAMGSDTLESYGQEPESGELGAGDVADATEEATKEGGDELDLGAEGGEEGGLGGLGGLGGGAAGGLEGLGGEAGGAEAGLEGLGGEGEAGGLEGLGLGGEAGAEPGAEGEAAPEDETFGLEEEEPKLEDKDAYGEYAITEAEKIDDNYGPNAEQKTVEEAMDGVVADLRNLFEKWEKPWEKKDGDKKDDKDPAGGEDEPEAAEGGPAAAEDTPAITETGEDEPAVKEAKETDGSGDIKNKDVESGAEGVKNPGGAAEDVMNKDNGGKTPGQKKLKVSPDLPKTGNKGSDSDCKKIGGKDPIKRNPENDVSSSTLKEESDADLDLDLDFSKGPFKKVK